MSVNHDMALAAETVPPGTDPNPETGTGSASAAPRLAMDGSGTLPPIHQKSNSTPDTSNPPQQQQHQQQQQQQRQLQQQQQQPVVFRPPLESTATWAKKAAAGKYRPVADTLPATVFRDDYVLAYTLPGKKDTPQGITYTQVMNAIADQVRGVTELRFDQVHKYMAAIFEDKAEFDFALNIPLEITTTFWIQPSKTVYTSGVEETIFANNIASTKNLEQIQTELTAIFGNHGTVDNISFGYIRHPTHTIKDGNISFRLTFHENIPSNPQLPRIANFLRWNTYFFWRNAPAFCVGCGITGHDSRSCSKATASLALSNTPLLTKTIMSYRFMEGTPTVNQLGSSSRGNNSNRQQPNKSNNNNNSKSNSNSNSNNNNKEQGSKRISAPDQDGFQIRHAPKPTIKDLGPSGQDPQDHKRPRSLDGAPKKKKPRKKKTKTAGQATTPAPQAAGLNGSKVPVTNASVPQQRPPVQAEGLNGTKPALSFNPVPHQQVAPASNREQQAAPMQVVDPSTPQAQTQGWFGIASTHAEAFVFNAQGTSGPPATSSDGSSSSSSGSSSSTPASPHQKASVPPSGVECDAHDTTNKQQHNHLQTDDDEDDDMGDSLDRLWTAAEREEAQRELEQNGGGGDMDQ
ncbi:hypothetical protein KI688_009048 [Linnemannia hyalina]|uniref:Uncharacterized protein n=1 Tax=Linnemannia hyalina TaxID=64524 RepID=A0A9P7XYA1_9FUNG|nr:hypothetical protein KI688_009048 [Linnemannia hyalina]